jgi:hypothetical protein
MATTTNNVNMFQKVLDDNSEMKSSYVHTENDSDSESDDACKIIIPSRPKKKNTDTSQELLFQLIRQNHVLSKTQKKMYQLQSELDKEEITTRYIKLDMNNIQVELNETKNEFKVCKKDLKDSLIENWTVRGLVLLYIIFRIYSIV